MLEHAVGKDRVKAILCKGQEAAIGHEIASLHIKLLRYPPGCHNRFQARVYAHHQVAPPGRADAPPTPIAADLQQRLALSWRQSQLGDWVAGQLSLYRPVQVAASPDDDLLHVAIDVLRSDRLVCGGNRCLACGQDQAPAASMMGGRSLLHEHHWNAVDNRISMPVFADETTVLLAQARAIPRANQVLQEPGIHPIVLPRGRVHDRSPTLPSRRS